MREKMRRAVLLAAAAAAVSSIHALQLDVQPGDTRCLGEELGEDTPAKFVFKQAPRNNKSLDFNSKGVYVMVTDPSGKSIFKQMLRGEADIEFQYTSEGPGLYHICFSSSAHSIQRVDLNVGRHYDSESFVKSIKEEALAGSCLQSIKYSLYVSYTSSRQYVLYKTHSELAQLITKLHSRGALGPDVRLPEVRLTLPELQQTGVAAGCRCASALVPHGRGRGGIPSLYSLQGCTCSGGRAWEQQQEQHHAPAGCFGGATRAQHCLTQTLEEVETFVCALLSTPCGSSAGQHAAQQQQQLRDHPLVQAFFWLPTSPSGSLLVVVEEEDDSDDWQAQGPAWAQDGVEWSYGA